MTHRIFQILTFVFFIGLVALVARLPSHDLSSPNNLKIVLRNINNKTATDLH